MRGKVPTAFAPTVPPLSSLCPSLLPRSCCGSAVQHLQLFRLIFLIVIKSLFAFSHYFLDALIYSGRRRG